MRRRSTAALITLDHTKFKGGRGPTFLKVFNFPLTLIREKCAAVKLLELLLLGNKLSINLRLKTGKLKPKQLQEPIKTELNFTRSQYY